MPRMKEDALLVQLDDLVCEHPDFEPMHEPSLNGYCFRCVPNVLMERHGKPEVEALLDVLNAEIVQAVRREGFSAVATSCVQGRLAIRLSFHSRRTSEEEVDATFEAIARWGLQLYKNLTVRYEPDMETKQCSSGSHSLPTEVSAI
jgi:glutamate/tyrosine decarboxylase-like PLP-dependent enzyme